MNSVEEKRYISYIFVIIYYFTKSISLSSLVCPIPDHLYKCSFL